LRWTELSVPREALQEINLVEALSAPPICRKPTSYNKR